MTKFLVVEESVLHEREERVREKKKKKVEGGGGIRKELIVPRGGAVLDEIFCNLADCHVTK
jgi:hypothetical protein